MPLATGVILDKMSWNSVFLFLAGCALLALVLLFTIIEPTELRSNGESSNS